MTFGALAAQAIKRIVGHFPGPSAHDIIDHIYEITFGVVVPLTVLVINVTVVREVRRASNSAAVNLGPQQSTSSNSAVPTAMIIATSLVYVLLGAHVTFFVVERMSGAGWCSDELGQMMHVVREFACVGFYNLIFAYNFFVYVVTGKQFRRELRRLCYCSAATAADNGVAIALISYSNL